MTGTKTGFSHVEWAMKLDPADFGSSLVLRVDGAALPADWKTPKGLAYTQRLGGPG